ncbi:MAG: MBL fold metallo-hydrolase [Candidatus Bathyarchaeota archaeon]|jgi:L-ascorbate metabolism protein UlaG (beta-lactamase superfamily)|nr:MBL fold metallo-hydrolase [Candidatus Bathyarchaeota archaeon A05DMB-5]MDH7558488.1 MBL fold metallo-hydrolase [Candidatus Bathyarchaeota archaeon]
MSIEKSPAKNEILFVWFNRYAGVTLKTPSKTFVIDPVDVKAKNFQNVDAILITHEHYDHLDQSLISEIHKLTQCMVVADPTSARKLRNTIPSEKLQEVQPGSEIKIGEVSVKAEKCNHPPATTPTTFIITSEDGVKVFHTADSLPFPEMASMSEKEKFDVVFCTVGIAPGASPETGVEIVRLTKPKVAVPYHTGSPADQKKFAELLKKEMPKVNCLIPEVGKIYQVGKRT